MNEQQRVDLLKGEISDLFELNRGSLGHDNCPSIAYTSLRTGKWVSFPAANKRTGKCLPAQVGYDCMTKHLGVTDRFAVAVSPRKFAETRWLSLEWDIPGIIPDEAFVKSAVNHDIYELISRRLTPHWKFTGNRSVHLDIFTASPISKSVGARLLTCFKYLFDFECDKTNLTQCMRLPLSRHRINNGLCRYSGCHTDDAVADYIMYIEPNAANDMTMAALCDDIEAYVSDHNISLPTVTTLPMLKHTYGIGGVVSGTQDTQVTSPTAEQYASWQHKLNHSPFLKNHARRDEFCSYIKDGIPQGMLNRLLFEEKAPFTLFVTAMAGVKEDAHAFMRYLVSLNVSDETQLQNRLTRVDYLYSTCFQTWQDCDFSYMPAEKLKAYDWLPDFVHAMEERFMEQSASRRLVNNLIQVMQYCLLLLYSHPEGATIAVADICRKLGLSNKTAIKHLQLLRTEFPVLTVQRHHNHFKHLATDYVLNRGYVESVLGYSISVQFELAA